MSQELAPYFDSLRFFPHRNEQPVPIERAILGTENTHNAHKVYLRDDLVFDNQTAIARLKENGINSVLAGPENQIITAASHFFAPVGTTAPILVSFKFNSEHNGKAPASDTDCILKPLKTIPLSEDAKAAWIEILPEVRPLKPEDNDVALFQNMLLKRCAEQNLVFWDPKVDYRYKREGVLHEDTIHASKEWAERSNIGLIPVIKDGKALIGTDGKLILAPVIIDAGSVMPPQNSAGVDINDQVVPNLQRKDLTFGGGFKEMMGYDHSEILQHTQDAPSLSQYVSKRAGKPIEISYDELIQNYTDVVRQMGQIKGLSVV